ncbi:MAG: hypothetical protein N2V75_09195 [Methanophagales archaeon]|nr:hypothetical protein [Methanophagales archaeon]
MGEVEARGDGVMQHEFRHKRRLCEGIPLWQNLPMSETDVQIK